MLFGVFDEDFFKHNTSCFAMPNINAQKLALFLE
jgi:hypothetical protein